MKLKTLIRRVTQGEKVKEKVRRSKTEGGEQLLTLSTAIEAHPVDVGIQFIELCKEILKVDELDILPLLTDSPWANEPKVSVVPVNAAGETTTALRKGRVKLPFGDVNFQAGDGDFALLSLAFLGKNLDDAQREGFQRFAVELQSRARSRSIYRGKIIDSQWKFLSWSEPPLILPEHKVDEIEANLLYPLRIREQWGEIGLGDHRTALLVGTFGCGKTSVARLVALEAIRHGWTFLVVKTRDLPSLDHQIRIMSMFKPAIVFTEDVDSITMEDDEMGRGLFVNALLNMMDGTEFDPSDMMFLMTSNFGERITPALKRPGRIDCIVTLDAPDRETAKRTFEHYSGNGAAPSEQLMEGLAGMSFAEIREVVIRARLLAGSKGQLLGREPREEHYLMAARQLSEMRRIMREGMRYRTLGIRRGEEAG